MTTASGAAADSEGATPRRAVALRHVLSEDLGLLAPVLERRGYRITYLDAGIGPLDAAVVARADLLVVLGGPVGAGDVERYPFLGEEIRVIGAALEAETAVLGICLGAQLLASALGATVTSTGRVEIGYGPVTLTAEGGDGVLRGLRDVPVLHWHGDEFSIPAGARRLAETPGFPNQAFAIGAGVLGLQFHPEVDPALIERWLILNADELASHGIDPGRLRDEAEEFGPMIAAAGPEAVDRWLDGLLARPSNGR